MQNGSQDPFDGISNAELESIFGDSGTARNIRLALRLFHYGCPAVYLDQGGYDFHSDEEIYLAETDHSWTNSQLSSASEARFSP